MRILITGAWDVPQGLLKTIENMGHDVIWHQQEREKLSVPYESIEAVICNGLFLYHPIEKFTSLKYIQLTSAGFDRVPMEYIREKGIRIHNARGVYSTPMAEFAVCGVLQLYKQSRFFTKNQEIFRWEKHRGLMELAGKHVCIVGCGSVGNACAKRFRAFDCNVTGVDILPGKNAGYDRILPLEQLDEILPEADIVVLTLPLTEETFHMMDHSRFGRMKPGAVLVNIARGSIVHTQSLVAALNDHLGGAVLDVFEEEPLGNDSPLWHMEHVILTPHNSFVGEGNSQRLGRVIMDNLERYR